MRLWRWTSLYYGWLVVGAAFISTGLTVGTSQYAFGVFVEPLEKEFRWTRTQLNAALSISAVAALISPIVGHIMDRTGAKPVMAISLAFLAVSFVLRPLMSELWHWYALGIVQTLGSPGATILPAGKLVGMWFQRTRGRMMGIATMGNNFGGLTMAPLAGFVVGMAGWRWGYGVFAILTFAAVPLMLLVVRDRPEDVRKAEARSRSSSDGVRGPGPALHTRANPVLTGFAVKDALRSYGFYFMTLGIVAANFSYAAVLTQLIPHLENEGCHCHGPRWR